MYRSVELFTPSNLCKLTVWSTDCSTLTSYSVPTISTSSNYNVLKQKTSSMPVVLAPCEAWSFPNMLVMLTCLSNGHCWLRFIKIYYSRCKYLLGTSSVSLCLILPQVTVTNTTLGTLNGVCVCVCIALTHCNAYFCMQIDCLVDPYL